MPGEEPAPERERETHARARRDLSACAPAGGQVPPPSSTPVVVLIIMPKRTRRAGAVNRTS